MQKSDQLLGLREKKSSRRYNLVRKEQRGVGGGGGRGMGWRGGEREWRGGEGGRMATSTQAGSLPFSFLPAALGLSGVQRSSCVSPSPAGGAPH